MKLFKIIMKKGYYYILILFIVLFVNIIFLVYYFGGNSNNTKLDLQLEYKKGNELFSQNNYSQALIVFNKVLIDFPNHIESLSKKCDILVYLGKYDDSFDCYYKIKKYDGKYEIIYKALVLLKISNNIDSMEFFNKNLNINNPVFDIIKSKYLLKIYQFEQASTNLDMLLKNNSRIPEANYLKALSLYNINNYTGSIVYFDKALSLGYYNETIFYNKGLVYNKINNYSGAIENFQKSLSLSGFYVDSLYQLSTIYKEKKQYNISLDYIQQILQGQPNNIKTIKIKGDIYYETKQYKLALESYLKGLEFTGGNMDLLNKIVSTNYKIGNSKGVDYYLEKIYNSNNFTNDDYFKIGLLLTNLGEYSKSLDYLNKISNNDNNVYFAKGYSYYKLNDINNSLINYKKLYGSGFNEFEYKIIDLLYLFKNNDYYKGYVYIEQNFDSKDIRNEINLLKLLFFEKMEKKSEYDILINKLVEFYPQLKTTNIDQLINNKYAKYLSILDLYN